MTSLQHPGVGEPVASADGGRSLKLLSVVAPVYNEVATIEQFYARVCAALQGLQFEIVLVDDGSTDGSDAELQKLAGNDPAGPRRPALAQLRPSDRADRRTRPRPRATRS